MMVGWIKSVAKWMGRSRVLHNGWVTGECCLIAGWIESIAGWLGGSRVLHDGRVDLVIMVPARLSPITLSGVLNATASLTKTHLLRDLFCKKPETNMAGGFQKMRT